MNYCKATRRQGFTIVELLIVIVIIGVLAAISIVAYNGVQQRAKNGAIISVASQSIKAIQLYVSAENGQYPSTVSDFTCITKESGCKTTTRTVTRTAPLDTNLKPFVSLPMSVPGKGGVMYHYFATRTLDGVPRPMLLLYELEGSNQQCEIDGVIRTWSDTALELSSVGYTGSSDGKTSCIVSVP